MKKITVPLSTSGIERLQKELSDYRQWQKQKAKELAERCAMLGASVAALEFSRAIYTGTKDATVKVVKKGNGYIVRADGKSVLFIEFGSGIDDTFNLFNKRKEIHSLRIGNFIQRNLSVDILYDENLVC